MWQHFKTRLKETYSKLELWRYSLKKIEGNFGTGVVAYFLFLKWLMFLNLVIFFLILLFIILPVILLDTQNVKSEDLNSLNCSCYEGNCNTSTDLTDKILDIIQGTGEMKNTILFYGKYSNRTLISPLNESIYYNLPLAYIFVTISIYFLSLISIVKSAARGFKERLIEGEGQFYHYCNLVFGGWDYCIHNQKSAEIKHKALFNEIKACLEAKRLEDERKNRSRQEKIRLFFVRTLVNIFVIAMLIGSMSLIIYVFNFCQSKLNLTQSNDSTKYIVLLLQFLPSLSITLLNIIVPIIFRNLITFERYSPSFVVRLTLLRTVILKLLSLGVLVYTLYDTIDKQINNKQIECWETYVGQQIYKLIITDFAIHVLTTFFINFPRALIARRFDSKFAKFIGEQQYDLPKNVLDVVYSQTLCWLGVFFAPLLPAIASIAYFFMFYIKKFVCLINSTPSSTVYRASRSTSMFMFVLLIAHCLSVIPVALSIAEMNPSKCCGPFKDLSSSTVWQKVTNTFEDFPDFMKQLVFKIGTAWFAVPVFIFLVLCIYYYSAVTDANRHMVDVLKNQLVLEGHDKQFLLNRLVEFSKQQQEYQRRIRNAEMMRERDRVSASQ